MKASGILARVAFTAGLAAGSGVFMAAPTERAAAQAPVATATFTNERYRYAVALPAGCRHEEGPGTIDAVCAQDFDAEHSAQANSAAALVMEVGAEIVADDAHRSTSDLAQHYDEKAFRQEIPQAVCGESEGTRARINNLKQATDEGRVTYTADVICAEVRFLQIAERRASVRYIIAPEVRYRLVARAPAEVFEKQKSAIDAFFQSFRVLPSGKQSQ